MVAASRGQHVRHQLSRDGRTAFVLLILARIGEVRNDGRDTSSGSGLASVDHNEELHQAIVNVVRFCRLQDENCKALRCQCDSGKSEREVRRSLFVPSSSRTLSPMVTLVSWLEYCKTMIFVNSMPSLQDASKAPLLAECSTPEF